MDFEISYRTIEEMRSPEYKGLSDPFGVLALTEQKRKAFCANPFLTEWNDYCQIVASSNGVAFGCEIHFPLLIKTPNGEKVMLCGSTTSVAKPYRKTGVGAMFGSYRDDRAPGHYTGGGALSQLMVRVLSYLKVDVMLMPRFVSLFRSRAVLERMFKGVLLRLACMCCDAVLHVYYWMLFSVVRFKVRNYSFEGVKQDDQVALREIARLVAADPHPFAEVHDERWLRWMMSESFSKDGPNKLIRISRQGKLVGFYMTKIRFYEQASHRGFKNVWLGSLMEWAVVPAAESLLPWFLLYAELTNRKGLDAFELVTADKRLGRCMRFVGAVCVGDSNYTVSAPAGAAADLVLQIKSPDNWRLRPANGDGGLN